MNKSLIIISLLILLFTTIGCDKDDFVQGSPVIEAKQDSLSCKMWLHNVQGDTTNVFHEGEDIRIGLFLQSFKKEDVWVPYDDMSLSQSLKIFIYQSNSNYLGYPFPGIYEAIGILNLLTNKKSMKKIFKIDKLDNGKRLSKGEYYLTLQYKTTLFRIDTTYVNDDEIIAGIRFPIMRFNFKIK